VAFLIPKQNDKIWLSMLFWKAEYFSGLHWNFFLYWSCFLCCLFNEKAIHIKDRLPILLSICHKNLMLTITKPLLNISSPNFQIVLLISTPTWWYQMFKVKVTSVGVFPLSVICFAIVTKHPRATQVFNWKPI